MIPAILEWLKAIGVVFAAVSLYLAFRQLRASVRWNRINATFTYLPSNLYIERERAAAQALETIGVDLYQQEQPLSPDNVDKILNTTAVFKETKDFLNMFEDYATAYKAHAIDRDHSYVLSVSQFINHYVVFKPFIDKVRSKRGNDMIWVEFERLVKDDWLPRRDNEIEEAARVRSSRRAGRKYP